MILESAAAIVAGFALLAWGADRFVVGAAATARNLTNLLANSGIVAPRRALRR